jgi:hypothetical protein
MELDLEPGRVARDLRDRRRLEPAPRHRQSVTQRRSHPGAYQNPPYGPSRVCQVRASRHEAPIITAAMTDLDVRGAMEIRTPDLLHGKCGSSSTAVCRSKTACDAQYPAGPFSAAVRLRSKDLGTGTGAAPACCTRSARPGDYQPPGQEWALVTDRPRQCHRPCPADASHRIVITRCSMNTAPGPPDLPSRANPCGSVPVSDVQNGGQMTVNGS